MKDPNKILTSPFIDLVFEGKNKAYGAYYMEKTSARRLWLAVMVSTSIVIVVFVSTAIVASVNKGIAKPKALTVKFIDLANQKKKDIPPPPPPPKPKVNKVKLTDVNIVKDNQIQANERPVLDVKSLTGSIGTVNQQGKDEVKFVPTPKSQSSDIFDAKGVEIQAEKPREWEKFLRRTLRANVPTDNGAPVGTYRVLIEFVVEKDGSISGIKALTHNGYGMEDEAIRVLKLCPAWSPGMVSGKPVRSYFTQPITFEVAGE